MSRQEDFLKYINTGYTFKGEHFKLGCAMLDGEVVTGADVFLPLKPLTVTASSPALQVPVKPRPSR